MPGKRYKSYAEKFLPPFALASQYLGNVRSNLKTFLHNDFHMKAGMKFLIESFYRSIADGTPAPIPSREIILTARIMEAIFKNLGEKIPSQPTPVFGTNRDGCVNRRGHTQV